MDDFKSIRWNSTPVSYTHLDVYKRQAIGITPYSAMYEKQPPREIEEILEFPSENNYSFDRIKFL